MNLELEIRKRSLLNDLKNVRTELEHINSIFKSFETCNFERKTELEKQEKELLQQLEQLNKPVELKEDNNSDNIPIENNSKNNIPTENIKEAESDLIEIIEKATEKVQPKEPIKPPYKFNTTQKNVVIPTQYLIKQKNTDFRVVLAIMGESNCDNPYQEGSNTRYITISKLDRRAKAMCETIGIDISNFNKKIRTILKHKSDEFKVVDRIGFNNTTVKCYEINYESGGFVTIPIAKAERCLLTLGNNPIKLYCNLLWLCQQNGEFIKNHIPQSTLAQLMGLSPNSEKIVKASVQTLINEDLIQVTKVKETVTTFDENNLPITQVREKLYYEIIVDEEN